MRGAALFADDDLLVRLHQPEPAPGLFVHGAGVALEVGDFLFEPGLLLLQAFDLLEQGGVGLPGPDDLEPGPSCRRTRP